jgi:hypothetical protein
MRVEKWSFVDGCNPTKGSIRLADSDSSQIAQSFKLAQGRAQRVSSGLSAKERLLSIDQVVEANLPVGGLREKVAEDSARRVRQTGIFERAMVDLLVRRASLFDCAVDALHASTSREKVIR